MKKLVLFAALTAIVFLAGCERRGRTPVLFASGKTTMFVDERMTVFLKNEDGEFLAPHILVDSWSFSDNLKCSLATDNLVTITATQPGEAWVEAFIKTCNGKEPDGMVLRYDITVLTKDE